MTKRSNTWCLQVRYNIFRTSMLKRWFNCNGWIVECCSQCCSCRSCHRIDFEGNNVFSDALVINVGWQRVPRPEPVQGWQPWGWKCSQGCSHWYINVPRDGSPGYKNIPRALLTRNYFRAGSQPCSSYECHLTYGAVFGLSNRNFLTIWLEWSKSLNLITCSDGVNIFKISNVTALTARLLPIVKLRTRSRSRSGEGQEGQIWTLAVLYFWFSPEHGRL